MYYARRKRLEEVARLEAEGESLWTRYLDEPARYKLRYAVEALVQGLIARQHEHDLLAEAHVNALRDLGSPSLTPAGAGTFYRDFLDALLLSDEDVVFTALEALYAAAKAVSDGPATGRGTWDDTTLIRPRLPQFEQTVRTTLREHRVSFDLVDGTIVPLESRELHEAVVIPTLTLLGGAKGLEMVEKAYRDALDQIAQGQPENAITDSGTALQEALTALGCDGNALGPLIESGKKRGLFAPHDAKLLEWISADRSNKGDAHKATTSASLDDAWLAVHVVGAVILRIAGGPPRAGG